MPVTKQHTGRVVAAPARCKRYNIPDSELKGFGLRVEPPRQDGVGTKSWYVQAMAGTADIADRTAFTMDLHGIIIPRIHGFSGLT